MKVIGRLRAGREKEKPQKEKHQAGPEETKVERRNAKKRR